MLTLAKYLLGTVAALTLVILGASILKNGPQSQVQMIAFEIDTTAHQLGSSLNFHSVSGSASAFVNGNATTAKLQIEGMKNSLPRSAAFSAWVPRSTPNWIQNGAQQAAAMAGNKPGALAGKIPVVNGALNATSEHIASLRQSLSGAASGF
jgi:hypothetical protein